MSLLKPLLVKYELSEYRITAREIFPFLSEWGIIHRDKVRSER
jgi:hypothetical protein